jgi:hypothetical protein
MRFVSCLERAPVQAYQCCTAETPVKPVNEFDILSQAVIVDVYRRSVGKINTCSRIQYKRQAETNVAKNRKSLPLLQRPKPHTNTCPGPVRTNWVAGTVLCTIHEYSQ